MPLAKYFCFEKKLPRENDTGFGCCSFFWYIQLEDSPLFICKISALQIELGLQQRSWSLSGYPQLICSFSTACMQQELGEQAWSKSSEMKVQNQVLEYLTYCSPFTLFFSARQCYCFQCGLVPAFYFQTFSSKLPTDKTQ